MWPGEVPAEALGLHEAGPNPVEEELAPTSANSSTNSPPGGNKVITSGFSPRTITTLAELCVAAPSYVPPASGERTTLGEEALTPPA